MEEYEPKPKCRRTKNDFRFSNPRCLGCEDRVECWANTEALQKEAQAQFRTLPWEILQLQLSSEAKIMGSVYLTAVNSKRIKPKGKKNKQAIQDRGVWAECALNHAQVMVMSDN
jgi:hypothetical protein